MAIDKQQVPIEQFGKIPLPSDVDKLVPRYSFLEGIPYFYYSTGLIGETIREYFLRDNDSVLSITFLQILIK